MGVILAALVGLPDISAAVSVNLQVQVFLASNQPEVAPDPRLASLVAELRKALPYRSFQLLSTRTGRVNLRQSWRTELPGGDVPHGRVLELTPIAIDRGVIRVQALVAQTRVVQGRSVVEQLVNTSLGLQSGGTVVLGGPAHLNGVLVIVISASAS
jgi:hypothetical protein